MTYRTMRQRFLLSAGSTVIIGLLLAATDQNAAAMPSVAGTATSATTSTDMSANAASIDPGTSVATDAATAAGLESHSLFWEALDATPQDAWAQLRDSFSWDIDALSPKARARVDKWIARYRQRPENIAAITRDAEPWLAWITQQVDERGLPGEIALLPFIESSFDPGARNYSGAAGLWQFMPRTGDALGLVRNGRYDGRLDVAASTGAALDYIEMQADQWYGGDIALSLAAYNAGAGTVNNARRVAERQGRSGDYWALNLPGETMQYLPKLYAIAQIIDDPERYNVKLPEIHAVPAFATVTLDRRITLKSASQLLDVSQSQLARLNPGLLKGALDPTNTSTLLVPSDADQQAIAALSGNHSYSDGAQVASTHHVERGDNLSTIATRYNVSQQDLMRWNALDRPSALQPGQQLTLTGG